MLAFVTAEQRRIVELEAENAQLRGVVEGVEDLQAKVERLTKELDALKALLGKNSSNSSMPPSRDDQASRQSRQARRAATRSRRRPSVAGWESHLVRR